MEELGYLKRLSDEILGTKHGNWKRVAGRAAAERCVFQLRYAWNLTADDSGKPADLVLQAVRDLREAIERDDAITIATTRAMETKLAPLAAQAKQFGLLCVGHAHIDMNWMWGYDETCEITLDTVRTMLQLMEEYPQFTYGQSQASVYRILQRHAPELLEQVRARILSGQWEVTASTWVEADRNLPSAESMVRHFLYTRQELSKMLGVDPNRLNFDFEPDTFGHHAHVPEVLADAGIRYYYHCRGAEHMGLINWQAPSGRRILVYREPSWYNLNIDGTCALDVPEFCRRYQMNNVLRVYGVGDHGGGPTRRDIERIIDMNTWPIFPRFTFGSYRAFYEEAERQREHFPTFIGEMNFIFDGCYTTQTQIKKGNRDTEQILVQAEAAASLAHLTTGAPLPGSSYFQPAWEKVLFNQFHDILPGSGKVATREHAMALYQEVRTTANTARSAAARAIAASIDSAGLADPADGSAGSRSEGAGVGFGSEDNRLSQTSMHAGRRRLFVVPNFLPFARRETVRITVWDWPGDADAMIWRDGAGQKLPAQAVSSGRQDYWGHEYLEVLIQLDLPAGGYQTVVLDELEESFGPRPKQSLRVEAPPRLVLENEWIRAEIHPNDGSILTLLDKASGTDLIPKGAGGAGFEWICEDPSRGMTAWTVGRYRTVESLNQGVRFTRIETEPGLLRQVIAYVKEFGNGSQLAVELSLDAGENLLRISTEVRWQEIGSESSGIPQLRFQTPCARDPESFLYGTAMGSIERPVLLHDVPAHGWALARAGTPALALLADCKYGYRGSDTDLAVTLIRSSFDPDPWPEIGLHKIRLALAVVAKPEPAVLNRLTQAFVNPPDAVSARAQAGHLPLQAELFRIDSPHLVFSAWKPAEDGDGFILRFYESEGRTEDGVIELPGAVAQAELVNLLEQPLEGAVQIAGRRITVPVRAYGLISVRVRFAA